MSVILISPNEAILLIAKQAKEKRLSMNLTQLSLAQRSGVSYGTLKKFERTGKISLESLLQIALILGCLTEFTKLFQTPTKKTISLDEIINQKNRQRGRK
jgi:transcriptional regulator with XRE-family HTH domain